MKHIDKNNYNVLIVEDNPGDFIILEDLLLNGLPSRGFIMPRLLVKRLIFC